MKKNLKIKGNIIIACVVIVIIITVIITKKMNVDTEVASLEKGEIIKKQEEQNTPKALTEIKEREKNSDNYTDVTSEDNIEVPVPKGYVASPDAEERYVNGVTTVVDEVSTREHHGGFVIYERLAEDAEKTDREVQDIIEDDLDEAQRTRNQWVWVPIEDVTDMYHVSNGQLYGNTYTFSASGYSKSTGSNREPALVSRYDNDQNYLKQYLNGTNKNDFLQEMREEFYNMLKSVATYGGFYIGRYETGNINQKIPVVRKGNSNISSERWYLMYKGCKNLKGSNQSVKTGMIWGIQWDETLKWLIESGEKTYSAVGSNSLSWMNGSMTKRPTGYSEAWKANNIYDLAGNVWDSTMEYYEGTTWNKQYYGRSTRGSYYRNNGTNMPVGSRGNASYGGILEPYAANGDVGCRATLYIL